MTPFFSIIIPVYNVAPYLRECLESVLAQTFADWEAICVDDGSTDVSGMILDEYATRDMRFKVIHQTNAGVSAARNAGLDVVKGSWILFLDGDDLISSNAMEIVHHAIALYPDSDMIRFGLNDFFERPNMAGKHTNEIHFVLEDATRKVTFDQYYVFFPQYAYKRSVARDVRFENLIRGEDILFMGKCLERSKLLVATDEKLYWYRIRNGSALHGTLTFRALHDEVAYRIKWLLYMRCYKKQIDRRIIKLHELFIMEQAPSIARKFEKYEFLMFRMSWYQMIEPMLQQKGFSLVSKIIIWVCIHLKFELLFVLLCDWKYRIRNRIKMTMRLSYDCFI